MDCSQPCVVLMSSMAVFGAGDRVELDASTHDLLFGKSPTTKDGCVGFLYVKGSAR